MPITIHQATIDDAAILAGLMNQFDGTNATPEQVARRLQAGASFLTVWLGVLDGHVAGYACLRLLPILQNDEPHAELTDLYVDTPFRRRGIARSLLAHIRAVARDAGAREILLMTGFTNAAAQAAYRAAGYAEHALAMRTSFADPPRLGPPQPGV